jgi:hypothetical protein
MLAFDLLAMCVYVFHRSFLLRLPHHHFFTTIAAAAVVTAR